MITRERMYYEKPLLLTFLLTGAAGLFLPRQTSSNTLLTMPIQLIYVWQSVAMIGGALGLIGTALTSIPRRWMLGQVLLRSGLSLIGLQLTGYGVAVLGLFDLRALFVGVILLAFAWAAWRRVRRISKDIGQFREAFASQMEDADGLGHSPPDSGGTGRTGSGLSPPGPAVADKESEGGDQ